MARGSNIVAMHVARAFADGSTSAVHVIHTARQVNGMSIGTEEEEAAATVIQSSAAGLESRQKVMDAATIAVRRGSNACVTRLQRLCKWTPQRGQVVFPEISGKAVWRLQ